MLDHSTDICEEMFIESDLWKQDNHRSMTLQPINIEIEPKYQQKATPLLDLSLEFRDCQYAEFVFIVVIQHYPEKSIYRGYTKSLVRWGLGTYELSNGEKITGHFINDVPVGRFNSQLDIRFWNSQWQGMKRMKISNGFIYLKKPDYVYIGQIKNGYRNGKGIMYRRESTCHGQFKELQHGHQVMKFTDGEIHTGMLVQGQAQGHGKCKYSDGDIYEGQWILDKHGGFGYFSQQHGRIVQKGNWLNGNREGLFTTQTENYNSKRYYSNGRATIVSAQSKQYNFAYVGGHKNGQWNGQGAKRNTRSFYIGNILDGCESGQGSKFYHQDQGQNVYYKGSLISEIKQGSGFYFQCKCKLIGTWNEDNLEGQCTYIDDLGDIYIGSFLKNNKHGYGKLIHRDGSWYEGNWEDNLFHGEGSWETGRGFYTGGWKNGKRFGYGESRDEQNNVYKGDWLNDERHGFGIRSDPTGLVVTGYWRQDQYIYGVLNFKNNQVKFKGFNMLNEDLPHQITNQLMFNLIKCEQYLGNISQSKKNGAGTSMTKLELRCGTFQDDALQGFGQIIYFVEKATDSQATTLRGYFDRHRQRLNGSARFKESIFLGSFDIGLSLQGLGTQISTNGDFRIGNFNLGLLEGYGIHYIHNHKLTIQGVFKQGIIIGSSYLRTLDTRITQSSKPVKLTNEIDCHKYVGAYSQGNVNGEATWLFAEIDQSISMYSGSCKQGREDGKGSTLYNNGIFYDGYYEGGELHGAGISKMKNNQKEEISLIQWQYGLMNGNSMILCDQRIIAGQSKFNIQHGKQIQITRQFINESLFIEGIMQENIILKYYDGRKILSQQKNDQLLFGIQVTNDRLSYVGQVTNYQQHGLGRLIQKDVSIYFLFEGMRLNDPRDSYCIIHTPSGINQGVCKIIINEFMIIELFQLIFQYQYKVLNQIFLCMIKS